MFSIVVCGVDALSSAISVIFGNLLIPDRHLSTKTNTLAHHLLF